LEGLGASLSRSWLASSGSIADTHLGDEIGQQRDIGLSTAAKGARVPRAPQLHVMFETQLPRRLSAVRGGLGHQQADQVAGEQVRPQLLLDHRRSPATQHGHAEGRLEATEVEFDAPATLVQRVKLGFVNAGPTAGRHRPSFSGRSPLRHAQLPRGLRHRHPELDLLDREPVRLHGTLLAPPGAGLPKIEPSEWSGSVVAADPAGQIA